MRHALTPDTATGKPTEPGTPTPSPPAGRGGKEMGLGDIIFQICNDACQTHLTQPT
ncbi:MAG: hypothetical protein MUC60_07310 [Oscillatoria sp. Prado101]|nr:hypothetical protein [Oscillatoria sp. Prado101]